MLDKNHILKLGDVVVYRHSPRLRNRQSTKAKVIGIYRGGVVRIRIPKSQTSVLVKIDKLYTP